MKAIVSCARNLVFFLWHDSLSKKLQKRITLPTFIAISGVWTFPFQNLFESGTLQPQQLLLIRMLLTEIAIAFVILFLSLLLLNRYRKYKNTHELTDEELNFYLQHMNENNNPAKGGVND